MIITERNDTSHLLFFNLILHRYHIGSPKHAASVRPRRIKKEIALYFGTFLHDLSSLEWYICLIQINISKKCTDTVGACSSCFSKFDLTFALYSLCIHTISHCPMQFICMRVFFHSINNNDYVSHIHIMYIYILYIYTCIPRSCSRWIYYQQYIWNGVLHRSVW